MKVFNHKPKWGLMRRKASHTTINTEIVEIQAVVERETLDKWVERESQSVEEMGEEHYPLMGPGGGDELPLIWKPVCDVVGQVSGSPQFLDVSLCDGGDNPPASCSGHGWRRLRWN